MYCGVDDIQDLRHSRASECDLNHQTCGQTNSDMSTGRHMMGGGESGSMTCSSTPSTCSDPNQQPGGCLGPDMCVVHLQQKGQVRELGGTRFSC